MPPAALAPSAGRALREKHCDPSDKREAISTACRDGDVESLVNLADSAGGLLDDEFRATACKLTVHLKY